MTNQKYFLDFGAHLLQGLNQFIDLKIIDKDHHCLSFEANPYIFSRCLTEVLPESRKRVASLYLLNCAITGRQSGKNFSRLTKLNSCRVESHVHSDRKSDRFVIKVRNTLRKIRRKTNELLHGVEKIEKKKQLENTIATMASNILLAPPATDSGHVFSYQTEKVGALRVIDVLNSLESPGEVVIKMDIEGAEFLALQDLLDNINSISIKPENIKIYIEWHERFFEDIDQFSSLRKTIQLGLSREGVKVYDWV